MKYKIQKGGGDQGDYPLTAVRATTGTSDVRAESSELLQTVKALRTELQDMRTTITKYGKRIDALQLDATGLRKEIGQVTAAVSLLHEPLDTMGKALQEGTSALAAAAQALEAQHQREQKAQQSVAEEMQRQRNELQVLSQSAAESRQRVGEQLQRLVEKETQFQLAGANAAKMLVDLIQKLDQQTHDRLARVGASIQLLAQSEQAGVGQMADGFQKIQEREKSLSELLVGVNASLGDLAKNSEQVLSEDQRAGKAHLMSEAVRLNALGLKCLADGHNEEAARRFEQAREYAPGAFETGFNLAVAQLRLGRPDSARKVADELLVQFPDRRELHYLQGIASLVAHDFAQAQHHLGAIAESDAESEPALAAAGLAHLFNGDSRSAAAAFRRFAGSGQPQAQVLRQLGFETATSA